MTGFEELKNLMLERGIAFRENASGAELSTFRTGGPVSLLAMPGNVDDIRALVLKSRDLGAPYFVIGNGSNILIPDEGLDTLFIKLCDDFEQYRIEGETLFCGAGASMAAAAKYSVAMGLMGLEWAAGIPGTVGGAVAMNAGAYNGEIGNVIRKVTCIKDGELFESEVKDGDMGYRRSAYSYPDAIVLSAEFALSADDGGARSRMEDYTRRRREKQPLQYPSAGSTFKRPAGNFAGKLIEEAGLKGLSIGGAEVSEKHAGFIINKGGATSRDVLDLISLVQNKVCEAFGVMLEPEVKILK